jgi:hypothetical protein
MVSCKEQFIEIDRGLLQGSILTISWNENDEHPHSERQASRSRLESVTLQTLKKAALIAKLGRSVQTWPYQSLGHDQ